MSLDPVIYVRIFKHILMHEDHMIWVGSAVGGSRPGETRQPNMHYRRGEKKYISPRRFLYEWKFGSIEGKFLTPGCKLEFCITPEHMVIEKRFGESSNP